MDDLSKFGVEDRVLSPTNELVGCSLSGRAFLSLGAELFELCPSLVSVRLVAVRPYLSELAACPHLARLQSLSFYNNRLQDSEIKLLLQSGCLDQLKELDLRGCRFGCETRAELEHWAAQYSMRLLL